MKKSKTPRSLLFTLLTPIFAAVLLLLLFASITISAIYIDQTEQTQIQSNLEILRQTDISLQLVHNHISEIATDITQKPYLSDILSKPMESVQDEWIGRQKISTLFSGNPNAMVDYEMLIFGKNGFAVSSGNGGLVMDTDELMALPVFRRAIENSRIVYASRLGGLSYSTENSAVILGCRSLTDAQGAPYGGILISIREKSLRQFYQSFINQNTNILLLASDGTILSSNIAEDVGTRNEALLTTAEKNRENHLSYSRSHTNEIILSRYISYYDSYIISRISPAAIYQSFRPRVQTMGVIIMTLLLLLLSIIWIIRRNLLPLKKLADHMAGARDVPTKAEITGASEIELITGSYNKMTASLHQYLDELNEAHEKQRRDELDLLQMQINPHFLYNTLDSVKHLMEMHNTENACRIIDALISLLRSTLGKTNTMVPVAAEVTNVRNYISIIEPRYGGLITADIHAEPECLNLEMPNLLLQPLVENAFFHAFQSTQSGHIRIFISLSGDDISCEIIDNGDGMGEEQLKQTLNAAAPHQSATRIGLANVRERLSILYPGRSSFQITSEPGYGTNITLTFPAVSCLPL